MNSQKQKKIIRLQQTKIIYFISIDFNILFWVCNLLEGKFFSNEIMIILKKQNYKVLLKIFNGKYH